MWGNGEISVRKSEKYEKKWDRWAISDKLEKVKSVRKKDTCEKKWEMWEKVRCVRKTEKNVGKSEMCEEKMREVWVKVKCGKKWDM